MAEMVRVPSAEKFENEGQCMPGDKDKDRLLVIREHKRSERDRKHDKEGLLSLNNYRKYGEHSALTVYSGQKSIF